MLTFKYIAAAKDEENISSCQKRTKKKSLPQFREQHPSLQIKSEPAKPKFPTIGTCRRTENATSRNCWWRRRASCPWREACPEFAEHHRWVRRPSKSHLTNANVPRGVVQFQQRCYWNGVRRERVTNRRSRREKLRRNRRGLWNCEVTEVVDSWNKNSESFSYFSFLALHLRTPTTTTF